MNKHNAMGFIIGVLAFVVAFFTYEASDKNFIFAIGAYTLTLLIGGGAYAAFGPK